jgi:hypothetical protein
VESYSGLFVMLSCSSFTKKQIMSWFIFTVDMRHFISRILVEADLECDNINLCQGVRIMNPMGNTNSVFYDTFVHVEKHLIILYAQFIRACRTRGRDEKVAN